MVARFDKAGTAALDPAARQLLLGLPFSYVEARHRLGLVDDAMAQRLVAARHRLSERLERESPNAVAFYRADAYNAAASLQDKILFGRLRSEERRVGKECVSKCRSRWSTYN